MKGNKSLERKFEEAMRRIIADEQTPLSTLLSELVRLEEGPGVPSEDASSRGAPVG